MALAAVTVLGAAPASLARFVTRVYEGSEGLTVAMRSGLLVYFGNDTRSHAKWLSLARVLVSPSSAGAVYIDVRLPERPAAGFSATSASTPAAVQTSGADPTAAALAASLESAIGGGVDTSSSPSTTSASSTKESESASTATGSSTPSSETGSSSSGAGAASSAPSGASEASDSASTEAAASTGASG
jgi:hypothetical protein